MRKFLNWLIRRKDKKRNVYCDLCKYCCVIEPMDKGVCLLHHPICSFLVEDGSRFLVPVGLYCTDYEED